MPLINDNALAQYAHAQDMLTRFGQPSQATVDELRAIRRDLESLRASIQTAMEADARRHADEKRQAQSRAALAASLLVMFESFVTTVRDLSTVLNGLPSAQQAYTHPAAQSLYRHLDAIDASLQTVRRLFAEAQ